MEISIDIRQVFIYSLIRQMAQPSSGKSQPKCKPSADWLFFPFDCIFLTCGYRLELTNLGLLIINHYGRLMGMCFSLTRLEAPEGKERQGTGLQSLCVPLKRPAQPSWWQLPREGRGGPFRDGEIDREHHSVLSGSVEHMFVSSLPSLFQR